MVKTTDCCAVLNRHKLTISNFVEQDFLLGVSCRSLADFAPLTFPLGAGCARGSKAIDHVQKQLQHGQDRLLCRVRHVPAKFARLATVRLATAIVWLVHTAGSSIAAAVPVPVVVAVAVSVSVAFELRAVNCRRVSVGRFEVSDEVALVVQADLEGYLFHAQKT